jgi:hypothetical protein
LLCFFFNKIQIKIEMWRWEFRWSWLEYVSIFISIIKRYPQYYWRKEHWK